MSRSFALAGVALLCLSLVAPAQAAEPTPAVLTYADPSHPIDLSGTVDLQRVVGIALGRNFTVRIQQYTVFEAVDAVEVQKAVFEPDFNFNANKQVAFQPADEVQTSGLGTGPVTPGESVSPINYYTTATTSNLETAAFTVNDTIITGGTVTAGYTLVRSDYDPVYTLPNPSFSSTASIQVTQPLLQGAGTDYNRAAIESARLGVRISNLNFKSTILTMVLNVETTYYNLLYQREQYKVQEEELKQAQQLLNENTQKRQTGTLTDLDVMNARAGVASAQNQLILDRQMVQNSEDSLLQLLGDRNFTSVVGEIQFPDVGNPQVSFARSYKLARDNGPDLAVAQATIDQFKLAALKAKRNTLPELNVNGGLAYSSYAGSATSSLTTNWSGYNWTGGVTLNIPWGMHANRAQYNSALAQVHSQQVSYDQADQNLVVGVRSDVRGVEASVESVQSSAENTKFAEKAYELTKAQFDAGLATSYLVLQAQNTLETARVSELQAKVSLLLAMANLRFIEGSSLQLYRINLPE
jgi:outer membrane protein TolC